MKGITPQDRLYIRKAGRIEVHSNVGVSIEYTEGLAALRKAYAPLKLRSAHKACDWTREQFGIKPEDFED